MKITEEGQACTELEQWEDALPNTWLHICPSKFIQQQSSLWEPKHVLASESAVSASTLTQSPLPNTSHVPSFTSLQLSTVTSSIHNPGACSSPSPGGHATTGEGAPTPDRFLSSPSPPAPAAPPLGACEPEGLCRQPPPAQPPHTPGPTGSTKPPGLSQPILTPTRVMDVRPHPSQPAVTSHPIPLALNSHPAHLLFRPRWPRLPGDWPPQSLHAHSAAAHIHVPQGSSPHCRAPESSNIPLSHTPLIHTLHPKSASKPLQLPPCPKTPISFPPAHIPSPLSHKPAHAFQPHTPTDPHTSCLLHPQPPSIWPHSSVFPIRPTILQHPKSPNLLPHPQPYSPPKPHRPHLLLYVPTGPPAPYTPPPTLWPWISPLHTPLFQLHGTTALHPHTPPPPKL